MQWILIAGGYVGALVFFRALGGFGGAGNAVRDWGRFRSMLRTTPTSTSG
jgi:hypothetical protein